MSDLSSYLSTRNKEWSAKLWDGFIEAVQARLAPLEEQLDIQKEVTDAIIARGLTVIEQELAPIVAQADQILDTSTAALTAKLERFEQKVTGGTVICVSNTAATLAGSATLNLTVIPADREFFAPTPYIALSRATTVANWAIGKVNSFNRLTGALSITLEQVTGPGGPYTDWIITSLPGATLLQKAFYEQTLALRQQVGDDKTATGQDRAAALAHREASETAAGVAVGARNAAQAALNTFNGIWYGARDTEPVGAALGSQYLDISQTPNVVKVLQEDGWAPTVTVSVGGSRQQVYTATEGQTEFVVDGGFSIGSVNLNGVEMFHGHGVVLDPVVGAFAFDNPLSAGDLVVFRGYLANDLVDIYTKSEANALLAEKAGRAVAVRVDGEQSFTPAQKGQARANIGADVLAGFRNKIINGDFDIWQRGVSFPAISGTRYTVDRWLAGSLATTIGVSRLAMGAGQTDVPGNPAFGARITVASVPGASNYALFVQRIEGARTLSGKKATVTFYAKADAAKQIALELGQAFGTGGTPSSIVTGIGSQKFDLTTSWQKFTAVVDIPSIAGKEYGTDGNNLLSLTFWFDAGSEHSIRSSSLGQQSGVFDIAHVSIVEGDATAEEDPFSPRHIQQELALCQRYFEIVIGGYSGPATAEMGYTCSAQPRVEKRAAPSVSWYRANAVFRFPNAAPTIGILTVDGALFATMTATTTASTAYAFHSFFLDAEL